MRGLKIDDVKGKDTKIFSVYFSSEILYRS